MNRIRPMIFLAISFLLVLSSGATVAMAKPATNPSSTLLVAGLSGSTGSTIGPDGALYVAEGVAGRISRVDPQTGAVTTFTSGLPTRLPGLNFGGPVDISFVGSTAYVLVTLVGPDVGGHDVVGIYRVDGPNRFTVIADIGTFAEQNPPNTDFFVPTGVQYAMENYRDGFLVTDGHHNRVLWVSRKGAISVARAFDDIVPTGLAVSGNTVYMAEAGPVPHLPADGKVVAFDTKSPTVTTLGSGAPLVVDVEFGRGRQLFALSQGDFSGGEAGAPALPNTGALVRVNSDGSYTTVVDGLDQPTSVEFIGDTAYIVTLTGEIWKVDNAGSPPYGVSR